MCAHQYARTQTHTPHRTVFVSCSNRFNVYLLRKWSAFPKSRAVERFLLFRKENTHEQQIPTILHRLREWISRKFLKCDRYGALSVLICEQIFQLIFSSVYFHSMFSCFHSLWTVTRWNLYSFVLLVPNDWASILHSLHSYKNRPGCLLLLITCFLKFSWKFQETELSGLFMLNRIRTIISYGIIWRIRAVRTLEREKFGKRYKRTFSITSLNQFNHRTKSLWTICTLYGLSPVWIRMCRFKWLEIFVLNSQCGHCKWMESFRCCDLICL